MRPISPILSVLCALAVGVGFVAWLLPLDGIIPLHPFSAAFDGDPAQSVIGQRYFLGEPWHWPLLRVAGLAAPRGMSVAFTDSIPLALLPLKLLRSLLPAGFFVQQGWIALAWALQPVAAVYALRGAGERRWWPGLAAALLSVSMPSLLARYGQMSLCTHAILLAALGLYFRIGAGFRARHGVAAALLLAAALLVHPYLLAMAAALLVAAPLNLALRQDRRWLRCTAWIVAGLGLTAGVAALLGYGGAEPAGGFGVYSMNLLGPLIPGPRAALPFSLADPTGGQAFEGYQYLGGGVLLLALAAGVALARGGLLRRLAGQSGLLIVLAALFAFSLSGTIYAGPHRIGHMKDFPSFMLQFRATGRFFWPVSYALLIGSVVAIGRAWPGRAGAALLAAAVALQLIDTQPIRAEDRAAAHGTVAWSFDEPALAAVFARHQRLTFWPTHACGADTVGSPAFMQLLLLGSQTLMSTNTAYSARPGPAQACDPQAVLAAPWQPGELRIVMPPARLAERHFIPDADRGCWMVASVVLCSQDMPAASARVLDASPSWPTGEWLRHGTAAFEAGLGEGWGSDPAVGAWSLGSDAALRFHLTDPAARIRVTMHLIGLGPAQGVAQPVQVFADGSLAADWSLPDLEQATAQAVIPAGTKVLQFHISHPTRPMDRGAARDPRHLGLFVDSIRFDLEP